MGAEQEEGRIKRLLLVVDGDGAYRFYTGILLQRLDYTIHTTATAEEALELMEVALPALILAEMNLPRMKGIEFLKQLKGNMKTRPIPVIMYSLSSDPAVRQASIGAGAAAFLNKPLDPDPLYAAIQRATESTPRSYVRLNTCLSVVVGDQKRARTGPSDDCVTAVSEHGMYVGTEHPLPKGASVPLSLRLGDITINVEGVVLYSFERGGGPLRIPGMGIKFTRIRPEDRETIKNFIEHRLKKDINEPGRGGTR